MMALSRITIGIEPELLKRIDRWRTEEEGNQVSRSVAIGILLDAILDDGEWALKVTPWLPDKYPTNDVPGGVPK
jgi:metal-responsive CopG/Arc/MetJ family transcriptional regulator